MRPAADDDPHEEKPERQLQKPEQEPERGGGRNRHTGNDEPMGIFGQGFEHAKGWHRFAAHAK